MRQTLWWGESSIKEIEEGGTATDPGGSSRKGLIVLLFGNWGIKEKRKKNISTALQGADRENWVVGD